VVSQKILKTLVKSEINYLLNVTQHIKNCSD